MSGKNLSHVTRRARRAIRSAVRPSLPETLESRILFAAIPAPLLETDIGTPTATPTDFTAGTFTVTGAGNDFFGASDAGHFVYQSLAGDGTITARITGINADNQQTLAGLDIRSSLSPTAANLWLAVRDDATTFVNDRTTDGGTGQNIAGVGGTLPEFLRLTRAGNVITASVSHDGGATFTQVAVDTIALPGTALVGFAAASHDAPTTDAVATFTQLTLTPSGSTPPSAAVTNAPAVSGPQVSPYQFTVTYTGSAAPIKASTIGNSNILVTGPSGFSQAATLVSSGLANATTVAATYQVTGLTNTGQYQVNLGSNQVSDTSNNFVGAGNLGNFTLTADTIAPTAALTSALPITNTSVPTYNFIVTYSDNDAVKASSIGNTNLIVTGPGGYSHAATLVSAGLTDGRSVVAQYSIPTPTAQGSYTVAVQPAQVTDLSNNAVAAGSIGNITVTTANAFIYGNVSSTAGQALPGRHLWLDLNNDGKYQFNEPVAVSDSSGNYHFDFLTAGSYTVRQAPSLGEAVLNPVGGGQTVAVANTQVLSGVNFKDIGSASIYGSVTYVDGTGLAGRNLFLDINGDGKYEFGEPTAVTDVSGNYFFSSLIAGTYSVVDAPNLGQQVLEPASGKRSVSVTTGQVAKGIAFVNGAASVAGAPADLAATFLSTFPSTAVAGQAGTAKLKIFNNGSGKATGTILVNLLASTDNTVANALTTVVSQKVKINLAAGKSQTLTLKFNYPIGLPTGSYRLIAIVDPTNVIAESNKANNTLVSSPITITPSTVDLTGSFSAVPAAATIGQKLSTSVLVTNSGSSPAKGKFSITLYESPTAALAATPNVLFTLPETVNLKAGASKTFKLTGAVPSTAVAGSDFLIAQLNSSNSLAESNTLNNTVVSPTKVSFS